jgi:hypothetical protein
MDGRVVVIVEGISSALLNVRHPVVVVAAALFELFCVTVITH